MRNIKLILQYEGTAYSGWQVQKGRDQRTVQHALEEAVASLTGRRARVLGAGRTDAGVHAFGQAACFRTASALETGTIRRGLNALLPADITVLSSEEVGDSFHPIFSASGKVYMYLIAAMDNTPALLRRFVWRVPQRLSLPAMQKAARMFEGRHDFGAFMGAGSGVKDTVRNVREVRIEEKRRLEFLGAAIDGRFIRITVEGDGFLRHMVRTMVGTLVEISRGKIPPDAVGEILASGDRETAGPTAPAKGLFLKEVVYDKRR